MKKILLILFILAAVGFADSSYLALKHYRAEKLFCGVSEDCDIVATSKYSAVAGVPVALFGMIFYGFMLAVTGAYAASKNPAYFAAMRIASAAGILASAWFVYVQIGILDAVCLYCMVSAVDTALLFIVSNIFLKRYV